MNGTGIEKHVFISHRSLEKARADEIQKFLEQNGIRCWKAPESLHKRGSQDYNADIFDAIRKCGCLLFLLSNQALCSDWVRKEVKYAEKCRKPIIPYVIDPIPAEKYESDELVITLLLTKQILNEDQANDLSILLPYVRTSLDDVGGDGGGDGLKMPEIGSGSQSGCARRMTEAEFNLLLDEADFHLTCVNELSNVDYLDPVPRPFGTYRQELTKSVRIAASNLVLALSAVTDGVVTCNPERSKAIAASLYRLVFDQGRELNADVFGLAEPFARREEPWANFVMAMKFYLPSGGVVQKSQDSAFRCFSLAVRDPDNAYAMVLFGACWQWGVGCDVSGSRALFWYRRAAAAGCDAAYSYLGRLYDFAPIGISHDICRAEKYFQQGVDAGNADTMYQYGLFLCRQSKTNESFQMFVKAYEHGCIKALADLAMMVETCDVPKGGRYSDGNLLKMRALCANLSDWKFYMSHIKAGEESWDAAFDYAISGIEDRNPECAARLGDLVMGELADEQDKLRERYAKGSLVDRFGALWEFLKKEISDNAGPAAAYIRAVIDLAFQRQDVKAAAELEGYRNFGRPRSRFWKALVETELPHSGNGSECLPSQLRYLNDMSPYRFQQVVKGYCAKPGSSLERVQRIWEILRWLSYEQVDVNQILKQRSMLLTSAAAENVQQRIRGVVARFVELRDLAPELSFWKGSGLERLNGLIKSEVGLNSDFKLNSSLGQTIAELLDSLQAPANQSKELRMAVVLWRDENSNSLPGLDLAVSCYYSGYMWGDNPSVAARLATLFLVHNGRLRSRARNEGLIYAVSAMLKNAVYQKELAAVPTFLELMLFGFKVGSSVVEPDFEAIRMADAVIDEMTLPQEGQVAPDEEMLRFEVTYAMAKIYLDEGLYRGSRCEQQWGVSSLVDYTKASQWLSRAKDIVPAGREDVGARIQLEIAYLAQKGYVGGNASKHLSKNMIAVPEDEYQGLISRITVIAESLMTKVNTYPHVLLKDDLLDIAISTDRTAIMLMVLPEDADYAVCRIGGEVCHGRIQPTNGVVGVGFVEMLERLKAALLEEEPDSTVEIGVVAGKKMLGRIADCLGPEVESRGLNLFSYDDLGSQLDAVFAKYGDDGSSAETEEDGEKNPE